MLRFVAVPFRLPKCYYNEMICTRKVRKEKSFGLEKSKECRRISNDDITVLRNVSYLFYESRIESERVGRERGFGRKRRRENERKSGEKRGRGGGREAKVPLVGA
jgi:hypothetical protein